MNNLAQRLYDLRAQTNLKQEELAEALGVSRQAVSKWEMGTGVPSLENLKAISDFFGVTIDSLVKDSPSTPSSQDYASESPGTPSSSFQASVSEPKEMLPPAKTFFNAVLLAAAYVFSYSAVNGIQYFLTQFMGLHSLDALIGYTKVQPYLAAAMDFVFCFPLFYFMTAVFRDGACLLTLGRGYPKRLPDVFALWLISTVNIIASGIIAGRSYVFTYYLFAPFISCAVYLIYYLYLTRAKGFKRRLKVLLPALAAMIAVAAVFSLIMFATVSSDDLAIGERLARISWITRAMSIVSAVVSLASLTVMYDYGRIDEK